MGILKYSTSINCLLFPEIGLADYGQKFGAIDAAQKAKSSIEIPMNFACNFDNTTKQMYFVGYRSNQLFLPLKRDQLSQESDNEEYNNEKNYEDSKCRVGLHYEKRQVLTAVIVDNKKKNGVLMSEKIGNKRKVMAKIRYSVEDVSFLI